MDAVYANDAAVRALTLQLTAWPTVSPISKNISSFSFKQYALVMLKIGSFLHLNRGAEGIFQQSLINHIHSYRRESGHLSNRKRRKQAPPSGLHEKLLDIDAAGITNFLIFEKSIDCCLR